MINFTYIKFRVKMKLIILQGDLKMILSLLKGFSTSSSLLIAIGAQNAFVIRQGLRGQHLLMTALVCSLIDGLLILFGVTGFGYTISEYPLFIPLTKYFAILFLVLYGAFAFKSIFKTNALKCSKEGEQTSSARKILLSLLGVSLLNPHVYLDTVILLGSIASQLPPYNQLYFALGAIGASFTWFFALTFGARLLTPFFQKAYSWKIIDGFIAITMWAIAFTLLNKI